MLGIAISFDLGRYHATPWGAHVNDGLVEWPPSPWRILRGIFAASRMNVGLQHGRPEVDSALASLALAPPPTFRLPSMSVAHTRHYMPSHLHSPMKAGETDRVLDAFAALQRQSDVEVWWNASLADRQRAAFAAAVGALGYLGRSESVCSARLLDGDAPRRPDARPVADEVVDVDAELVPLLCPTGEDPLEALTVSIGDLRRTRRLQPPGTRVVDYVVASHDVDRPSGSESRRTAKPTIALFRMHGGARPALHDALAVGSLLRAALQRTYDNGRAGVRSPVFSGHAPDGPRRDQHRHAHYLALPDADGRRIGQVAVWAPEGFGAKEISCLAGLSTLYTHNVHEPLRVALTALGSDQQLVLGELLGPSRRWRSLTPFALPRHPKRRNGSVAEGPAEQIRRELGFRDPQAAELLTEVVPRPSGRWLEFRRTRPGISRLHAPHVIGAELTFAEPVRGPIALGALSHFGLGLFCASPSTPAS